jgi:hypothetical protein
MVYLVRALSDATADEFMRDLTLWPKAVRIRWEPNLYQAYRRTRDGRQPLVAYFYFAEGCPNCQALVRDVLPSTELNAMAAYGVFAQVDIDKDDDKGNVARMLKDLGLERYPVVAVLDAETDVIRERGRVTGYFPLAEFYPRFTKLLAPRFPFATP